MLQQIIEHARQAGLPTEPGFSAREAHWAIRFAGDGRYLGVLPLHKDPEGKSKRPRAFANAPSLTQAELTAGGGGRSHFLIDSVQMVFNLVPENASAKNIETIGRRHAYFLDLHTRAAEEVPALRPVADALNDEETRNRILQDLLDQKAKPTDKVTFIVDGIGQDPYIINSDVWHDWWRSFYSSDEIPKKESSSSMVCLATGQPDTPALTHNKIRHLANVGGLAMGDSLVSFKMDSFRSYGLAQSENSAVSEQAMIAYTEGLNNLLENAEELAGAKIAYWFKRPIEPEDDPFQAFISGDDQVRLEALKKARELLAAARKGSRVDGEDNAVLDNEYYALTLSANSGRVVIRDWLQGTFEQLVDNLSTWADNLTIISHGGVGVAKLHPLRRYVEAILPPLRQGQDRGKWLASVGAERTALWRAAVHGEPFPATAIQRILLQNRTFIQTGELAEAERTGRQGRTIALLHRRMALLKAYLNRGLRQNTLKTNREEYTMGHSLKPQHPEPAYHCGRLMAVYASVQDTAAGPGRAGDSESSEHGEDMRKVKAGVINRFFTSSATAPRDTLTKVDRLAQHHLNKLRRDKPGAAHALEERLAKIWDEIPDIPEKFGAEKEVYFQLGYYHQLAENNR